MPTQDIPETIDLETFTQHYKTAGKPPGPAAIWVKNTSPGVPTLIGPATMTTQQLNVYRVNANRAGLLLNIARVNGHVYGLLTQKEPKR